MGHQMVMFSDQLQLAIWISGASRFGELIGNLRKHSEVYHDSSVLFRLNSLKDLNLAGCTKSGGFDRCMRGRSRRGISWPSSRAAMSAALVPIFGVLDDDSVWVLQYAAQTSYPLLYIYFLELGSGALTLSTLDALALSLESAARKSPRQDVRPLLPSLGYSLSAVAALPGLAEVVAPEEYLEVAQKLVHDLNAARAASGCGDGQPIQYTLVKPSSPELASLGSGLAVDPSSASLPSKLTPSRMLGDDSYPRSKQLPAFRKVAVGGTFDRLHAGHRLLLAATAAVSVEEVYVGITADEMLKTKAHAALLESYEVRTRQTVAYLMTIRPSLKVTVGALVDPKVPTLAATDAAFDAIVVSEETIPGARAINDHRASLGLHALAVIVVPVLSGRSQQDKLSSTELRKTEA